MDLSVLIPSRNEEHLARTVADILEHMELQTEVIAIIDGEHQGPLIDRHPRVTLLDFGESVGQRAATNAAARLSRAKYVLKCDAHSSFSQGFDRVLVAACSDHLTTVCPMMRLLDATTWKPRPNYRNTSWSFDSNIEFHYWEEYRQRSPGTCIEVMSVWGGCWLMQRERYEEIGGLDEAIGSLGQMAEEVALKSWLSGGRVFCETRTWCAHAFREGKGRPYRPRGSRLSVGRKMWLANAWPKQTKPLSWLLKKFGPVPGWDEEHHRGFIPSEILQEGEVMSAGKSVLFLPAVVVGTIEERLVVFRRVRDEIRAAIEELLKSESPEPA